ncbi:hypothetical protein A2276_03740 [candidate division WOR-1 bacterium RIFOXYA12_FULL_43_27]|uniref:Transporter n=1 Tax=candidate division WOR-1 bacterium RIFOXYC2_FULL_46_14 TaxID=1802587 RepID=A0A1F4U744_UNCSA|nr:MAG: hypothetical protein A2276_03740 [candidate division WOR-1 bacterium RIFOXYA12_FULL_43_27]OGC19193.1 MAG: hypothetical protein A2292_00595 [candidate division WOR-1 bacterium RIFOXYB2_FULL_46_45]OGC30182.1 MAG: hypothetical protein A2232_00595 [candidate division WOR-1 bacterium RIFOXYA2_FULL_46_56]OGC40784.1 MAG: hypothetical protein A2438_00600 [candidate division WOR-1 bacterium RIFOXYC2_FULL_46_14]
MRKIGSSLFILLLFTSLSYAMTLRESVDYALKNNQMVLSTEKKLEAAKAKFSQAVGAFLPAIKLDGSYGRSYSQPSSVQISSGGATQILTFGTEAQAQSRKWSASLNQPVFVPALFPGYQIAQKGVELAEQDYRKIKLETTYNTTVAYAGVIAAERYVDLSKESLEMAKTHLAQVKRMYDSGSASRADLLRTEVRLMNADVELTKARNTLELSKSSFNNTLGRPLETAAEFSAEGIIIPVALPDYHLLLKIAFDNKPEWRQFLLNKDIAAENVSVARTGYLPSIFLSGQMGNSVIKYPAYESDTNSWTVAGAASWTIFDGFQVLNKVREANETYDSQKVSESQVKNNVALEVRTAYLDLKNALESLDSVKKAVEFAEENRKVSERRYYSGFATNLDVIDAQVGLTQAKINHIKAVYDIFTAKAKLNKIIGKEVS